MGNLLFVYGTLLNEDNEYAIYLKNNSSFYSEGKIKGKLYDLGEYPGAVLSQNEGEYIYGSIVKLNDTETVLALVDDYEGYGDKQQQPNLFIRILTDAETNNGPVSCWIYLYNLPTNNLMPIENGRYIK
jgi:gamma-glutamylcyclotransferase (GGCT)/AIG2-like uncharacterized protein YtfP